MAETLYEITEKPIQIQEVFDKVIHRNAGAVNSFVGTVREMTGHKQTLSLKYESYVPMAEKQLAVIGEEIADRWPETKTAITHRIGHLAISDVAVVIAVASPHRASAFEASRYAIERIKDIVPIWKKEYWADGTYWVGDQKEHISYAEGEAKEE